METVYEEDYDIIRTFLKIGKPKIEEKPYYDIDLEKNIFLLHDPIFKNKSDNSEIFEVNQIFTNKDDNSYIYEQICQNTISDALNGDSFVFISYGITISEKLEILIGNIENSNRNADNVGIFPRLLNKLIDKINNNKEFKDNLSINLSYICIYDNKLIDLSNYLGKDFSKLKSDNFLKDGIEIDNIDIIKKVKKVPTENYSDVLFFINKILLCIRKLEDDSNGELFTKSYIAIIIYITNNDGKIISKLIFILLNGSEQLSDDRQNKFGKGFISNTENKKILNLTKFALDTQYTYNSILFAIKNNESINNKKIVNDQLTENNLNLIEQKNLSKLTKVLFYPCFNRKIKNIKFIIIGSIMPLPGLHSLVKDTLLFLFECRKIKSNVNKNKKFSKILENSKKINFYNEVADDTIFNLEEKIKLQENKIANLNYIIESQNKNIINLEKSYKSQINVIKEYLGFNGDINILLSGYEYSKEMRKAKEIRESIDNVKRLKIKIKELEEKLKLANEEIKKNDDVKEVQINDKTMINYYLGAKHIKEQKTKNDNSLNNKISELKNELKKKDKIIKELKNDLDKKNDILLKMPKFLLEFQENKIEEEKQRFEKEEKEKNNEESNNGDLINKESKNLKIIKQKEYLSMLKNKDKEIFELKKKYDNILEQKEKENFDINIELNSYKNNYSNIFKQYEEELLKLNELFIYLVNNYQRIFLSSFTEKCNPVTIFNKKIQYDNILLSIKKDYDRFPFPLLYGIIEKRGKIINNNLNSASMRKLSLENINYRNKKQKILLSNNKSYINFKESYELNMSEKDKENSDLNFLNDILAYLKKQMKLNNIIIDNLDIEKFDKERLISEYKKIIKIISDTEEYIIKISKKIEKIMKENKNMKNLNLLEYENQLKNFKEKIERISNNLMKEKTTNNNNLIIIKSQNRLIEKLQQDLIYKEIPDYKMKLNKKINKKINLSVNKKKDYPNLINDNSSFNQTQKYLKNKRVLSSKGNIKKVDTEGSSEITSLIQKTNSSFLNNNTFMNYNSPIKILNEENKY